MELWPRGSASNYVLHKVTMTIAKAQRCTARPTPAERSRSRAACSPTLNAHFHEAIAVEDKSFTVHHAASLLAASILRLVTAS
jgi:hypothetical protein